jgi:hypothetical protein
VYPFNSYSNCSKVLNPLNKPNIDLPADAAAEPSASTVNVCPSAPVMASSEMLFNFPGADVRESVSELWVFALWIAPSDDAPRSGTRA